MEMKKIVLLGLILMFSVTTSLIAEEKMDEEPQQMSNVNVDEVMAACEDLFTSESYPDEDDRLARVNECVDSKMAPSSKSTEEG
jgi:hypothetical protein